MQFRAPIVVLMQFVLHSERQTDKHFVNILKFDSKIPKRVNLLITGSRKFSQFQYFLLI